MNLYATEAALAMATADLTLVQSLRRAIHNADLTGQQAAAPTTAVDDGGGNRRLGYVVNDRLGYRACDRPAGYYNGNDRALGYCAGDRTRCGGLYDLFGCCGEPRRFDPACPPPPPTDYRPTVQPPWKVLPWPTCDAVAGVGRTYGRHVKPAARRTDGVDVGRTLDLFV